MKSVAAPSRHGGAFRQGGRKVNLSRPARESVTPPAIGKKLGRHATRPRSATIFDTSLAALPFASCFAYLPGGSGLVCEEGRLLCARLKAADRIWLPRFAARVWLEAVGHGRFAPAFGSRVVLVPVPGSAPLQRTDWVGERVAWCLKELGLAAEVWPILRRQRAVRKSACAAVGERPSVLEHYASFAVEHPVGVAINQYARAVKPAESGLQVTLVDDVITRGRTLLAAARRVRETFPEARIRAFALLRTLGPHEMLHRVLDPCEGEVRWAFGDARRCP